MSKRVKGTNLTNSKSVFLSYAREDADYVGQLASDLKQSGISVWLDSTDLEPGEPNWERHIRATILKCAALVLVVSPSSFQSTYVEGELGWAIHNEIRVIPIRITDAPWRECVSFELAKADYVDCRPVSYQAGLQKLVQVIRKAVQSTETMTQSDIDPLRVAIITPYRVEAIYSLARAVTTASELEQPQDSKSANDSAVEFSHHRATSRSQMMMALGRLRRLGQWDIVHISGFNVVTSEPMPSSSSRADDLSVTPRVLNEILSMSLPAEIPLVVVDTSDKTVDETGDIEAPNWSDEDCSWIDDVATCAEAFLCVEASTNTISQTEEYSESVLTFLAAFYNSYAQKRAAASSLDEALLQSRIGGGVEKVRGTLRIRAQYSQDGLSVIGQVADQRDPLTLDLRQVQESLVKLELSATQVFDRLARKIQAHRSVFETPRENAFLALDTELYGEFSWNTTGTFDCITLFRLNADVDPKHWTAWSRLLLAYNDLWEVSRRNVEQRHMPSGRTTLTQCIQRFQRKQTMLRQIADDLVEAGFTGAWRPFSDFTVNLEMAEDKLIDEEFGDASTYLEIALMSLHELVKMCKPTS